MNDTCGCCEGIQQLTPLSIANRPGLDALVYRAGTHDSFLETMLARLSNLPLRLGDLEPPDSTGSQVDQDQLIYPLRALSTRAESDPAIALLDAWALVADILTFYQERIANEGYLRTATERRSLLELARLVGYVPRPGVAASVFLAYTLEKDHNVIVPPGNRAQSVPGPGELPQSFETAEKLEARFDWNALKPRLTRPQPVFGSNIENKVVSTIDTGAIYLLGTATKLTPGDPLLLAFGNPETAPAGFAFLNVSDIETQTANNRTRTLLQDTPATSIVTLPTRRKLHTRALAGHEQPSLLSRLVEPLSILPSLQPRTSQRLERAVTQVFSTTSDIHPQVLITVNPLLQQTLYSALAAAQDQAPQIKQAFWPLQEVWALPIKAPLFGHNLPLLVVGGGPNVIAPVSTPAAQPDPARFLIALDAEYKGITKNSRVVVERRESGQPVFTIAQVTDVQTITLGGTPSNNNLRLFTTVGASTTTGGTTTTSTVTKLRVTVLTLDTPWLTESDLDNLSRDPNTTRSNLLGNTTVYAQSEKLLQAEAPIEDDIATVDPQDPHAQIGTNTIELDRLYDGLKSGQHLIISGERSDVLQPDGTPIPGIQASELVMIAAVAQDVQKVAPDPNHPNTKIDLPSDKKHTILTLASPLKYMYKRESVVIYANVVRATHGETRSETLGSGDASKALQRFTLRQSPLTYVAAPTTSGVESTLQVRVNDILWHKVDSLPGLQPTDHDYITETDDAGKTTIIFGDGQYGSRLPTGTENVRAVYRTGIGKPGNVKEGQIKLLATKPLGVKSVDNPMRAVGGADRESIISARRNIPQAAIALDRLVSVEDYADFARTFAGIGKASAVSLPSGKRQVVYLTIAGADNIPIDPTADLYQNLVQALHKYGDPHQPLQVDIAQIMLLVISAHVHLLPDYEIESVEPKIRSALLDTFGFERRELGQPVFQSEVLSVIQGISGVEYVNLEIMGAVDQQRVLDAFDTFQRQGPLPEEPGEVEEPGETEEEEQAEEFLELLQLAGHGDVPVQPAQLNPNPPRPPKPPRPFLPAQLAFLNPDVPDTLIITELPR